MCITAERLRVLAPNARAKIVDPLIPALAKHLPGAGVNTVLRRAHFIAQICVESDGFRRLEENLYYRSAQRIADVFDHLKDRAATLVRQPQALACAAYANRLGNGDEASGDGWRFRGRGLIQLTGRANYRGAGAGIGDPLDDHPDMAAIPEMALRIALWFWLSRGCNAMADADDGDAITRAINGPGMRKAAERQALADKAKQIFARQIFV